MHCPAVVQLSAHNQTVKQKAMAINDDDTVRHTGESHCPQGGATDDDAGGDDCRLRLSCCSSTIIAFSRRCCSSELKAEDLSAARMPTISPSSSVEPRGASGQAPPAPTLSGTSAGGRVIARRQSLQRNKNCDLFFGFVCCYILCK